MEQAIEKEGKNLNQAAENGLNQLPKGKLNRGMLYAMTKLLSACRKYGEALEERYFTKKK